MPRISAYTDRMLTGVGMHYGSSSAGPKLLDYANTSSFVLASALATNSSFSSGQTHYGIGTSLYVSNYGSLTTFPASSSSWYNWPVTVEVWEYPTWSNGYCSSLGLVNAADNIAVGAQGYDQNAPNNQFLYDAGYEGSFSFSVGEGGPGWPRNRWNHVAYVIYSSTNNTTTADTIQIFVNGVLKTQLTGLTGKYAPTNLIKLIFGGWTDGVFNTGYTGYISEVRISNNRRYTGTTPGTTYFTPPASAFTIDANTIGLIKYSAT